MTLHDADLCAVRRVAALCPTRKVHFVARLACLGAASLMVANCSPQNLGRSSSYDAKYGVHASRRVIGDGEPVPKGGGREMVGRPYVVAGRTYFPQDNPRYAREGLASWYGPSFHGRLTANGEIFDRDAIAAAHPTMPLPSYARVTNLENGRSIIVRVNDRGPYHGNRIVDLSQRTAEVLDFRGKGTARVRVEYVKRASPNGSDDRILLSSLRTDGLPATMPGPTPTLLARAETRPEIPRQALALRSHDSAPYMAAGSAAAGTSRADAAPLPVSVPLPPERPLDLGTVPNATTPTPLAGTAPAARPPVPRLVAGLSFAASPPATEGLKEAGRFQPIATKDIAVINLRR
jgi:rare lipoprotein A